ncbi:MAG: diguanylate cyclase [Enterovirga sp.]|nr:diguanylate cyclase [Enterovirga sp.]
MRSRPLRFYVVALALAMTVPPVILSVLLAARWVGAERSRLQEQTHEIADAAIAKVDTFLFGKVAMLQALATSPAFETSDFARLDAQARELLDLQGLNVVLRDLQGQQLINTRRPRGTPLPKVPNYDADRLVAETGKPLISDLYAGVMAGGPLIRVIVPVIFRGRVTYTLTASLPPPALSGLLREAGVQRPHSASIAGRDGRILARAEHDGSLIGKPLPGFEESTGARGTWSGPNPEHVAVFGTYRRSPLSGWLYTVGVDQAVLDAPLYRSLVLLGVLAVVVGLSGFVLSIHIVRRVLQSQQQLSAAALALGNGEVVEPQHTPVREANEIGAVLAAASLKLHNQAAALTTMNRELEARVEERARELSAQSALLQTTLDNMAQGLIVVDSDGSVPICNRRAIELLDLPPALMASKPHYTEVWGYQLAQHDFDRSSDAMRAWFENIGIERTPHSYVRERPNGTVLEIRTVTLGGGAVVRTYTDITAHKEAERVAHEMARRDALTGLANRTLFLERLAERASSSEIAVLCLDLDRFKTVNDTLGHFAGDAVLKAVGDRLRAASGPGDTVARLAGDEFAVLLDEGCAGEEAAITLARRLLDELGRPYVLEATRVDIGVSIGIAFSAGPELDRSEILKRADMALYRAKAEGRSTFRIFEAAMDVAVRERRALELDLRLALPRGEFEIHFQPMLTLPGLDVCSFEALLRWNHPARGTISPAEFIPIAEDTRLIASIGEWVLKTACREAATWPAGTRVAVNISPLQFQNANLVDKVVSVLAASGLAPGRLELEITEAVLMHESEEVMRTLRALRSLGVRIALDDFGTGFSSLSYLHRFPLDRVKIDRSFIRASADATSAAIVRTIIGLATRLGADITAEGVETQEQLEFVVREGCTDAQGFLFSRPVPGAEAKRFLTERRARAA